ESVCDPLATVVVFQVMLYGDVVSSAPSALPSSRNCTPATATLSDAFAEMVTVPATVAFAAGAVKLTVGLVVSGAAAVVTVLLALIASLPAASLERTRQL